MSIVNLRDAGSRVYYDRHVVLDLDESEYGLRESELIVNADEGGMSDEVAKSLEGAISSIKNAPRMLRPKKSYQWNTKNKSFIQIHKDLEVLGIKNNSFMLAIYDTTLLDADPYATVVPLEMQARMIRECIINPWYFLREVARVPEDGKPIVPGGGAMFNLDRNNLATWYLYINGIDHYSSKPRQCGKTMDALEKINYTYHFGAVGAQITFSNKDLSLNKLNLSRLKTLRDLLPLWMQMRLVIDTETLKIEKERSNVTSMKNPINKNSIVLLPTASTEPKADGIGRGYTSSIQMWDEFDWTPNNTRIIKASVFAYLTASENAKKNHSMYGRIFTSTPGNMDSKDGQNADLFINGKAADDNSPAAPGMLKWTDRMLDIPINKLKKIVNSKLYNGIVYVEHSWQQLKKSIGWYERACRGASLDPEIIAREILLKRLRGSTRSPFTRQQIMTICNNVIAPITNVDYSDNYAPITIYRELIKSTPYILAIDTSEGVGSDNFAMVAINPYTEKIDAEFACPYLNQSLAAKMIIRFMSAHCPKAMLVVENNRGREFIHVIQDSIFADRLWIDADKFGEKEKVNARAETFRDKAIGFNTNSNTRPIVLGTITDMVRNEPQKIDTKLVVDDICALEKNPKHDNRIAAAEGKHDDVIMAFGIGHTVLRHASNLDEWGITRGMIPPDQIDTKNPNFIMKKIMELRELLPANMRDMFTIDRNEVTDAFEYYNQVNKARMRSEMEEIEREGKDISDLSVSQLRHYNSEEGYNQFVDDVVSMNSFPLGGVSEDDMFDLDDYL